MRERKETPDSLGLEDEGLEKYSRANPEKVSEVGKLRDT